MHEEVLTITRVDDLQDIVEGYDGLAHHTKGDLLRGPPRKRMSYQKFQKDVTWHRHPGMSRRVGRIFADSVTQKPYVHRPPSSGVAAWTDHLTSAFNVGITGCNVWFAIPPVVS